MYGIRHPYIRPCPCRPNIIFHDDGKYYSFSKRVFALSGYGRGVFGGVGGAVFEGSEFGGVEPVGGIKYRHGIYFLTVTMVTRDILVYKINVYFK